MRALTVQQPWAWAIFHGKAIENRTQQWAYRGPLAIHAGVRWSERGGESPLVDDAFRRMAEKVDQQNAGDPDYLPMAPAFDGEAFTAARALAFDGTTHPSGYTEPLLHEYRAKLKARLGIA